jgi:hypothetical protein
MSDVFRHEFARIRVIRGGRFWNIKCDLFVLSVQACDMNDGEINKKNAAYRATISGV